jgi:hypothetical protein
MIQASSGVVERRSTEQLVCRFKVTGLTDSYDRFNRRFKLLVEKQVTARSGSLAYIRPHPGSFEVFTLVEP